MIIIQQRSSHDFRIGKYYPERKPPNRSRGADVLRVLVGNIDIQITKLKCLYFEASNVRQDLGREGGVKRSKTNLIRHIERQGLAKWKNWVRKTRTRKKRGWVNKQRILCEHSLGWRPHPLGWLNVVLTQRKHEERLAMRSTDRLEQNGLSSQEKRPLRHQKIDIQKKRDPNRLL